MTKTISIRPKTRRSAPRTADEWIAQGAEAAAAPASTKEKPAMKRLSLDLPATMHKELMAYCVEHDLKASELLRRLIEKEIHK